MRPTITRLLGAMLATFAVQPAARAEERAVIAVFDIEARSAKLKAESLAALSEFLAARLTASGQFEVIAGQEIKSRLDASKEASYASCYEQACQIELGKELAAQKTLATKISRLGSKCIVTSSLYDLRRATMDTAATAESSCSEDDLVEAVKTVVGQLAKKPAAPAAPVARADLTGIWTWRCCNDGYWGEMLLRQEGTQVTGTFKDLSTGGGGEIRGFVEGSNLTFIRSVPPDFRQTFRMTVDPEGKTMKGIIDGGDPSKSPAVQATKK